MSAGKRSTGFVHNSATNLVSCEPCDFQTPPIPVTALTGGGVPRDPEFPIAGTDLVVEVGQIESHHGLQDGACPHQCHDRPVWGNQGDGGGRSLKVCVDGNDDVLDIYAVCDGNDLL